MNDRPNTLIESLGVYLPPQSVTTAEVLQGCHKHIRFPLEQVTGIKTRRMAGQQEFAIDLARNAVANCLEKSKNRPADIDLLICCNISRVDGPDQLSFEPSTSVKLRRHFGFSNAIVFDITNACAGMFTGIYIVDAFIKTGAIRRGMVVSGEYITHLAHTAQREIESFMDGRLACLTLGDAGAALILEKSAGHRTGFQRIDLQTFGRYSPYCTAGKSETGGWIMYTDSVNLTDVALKYGAKYALDALRQAGWPPGSFQYLIMHQTSKMTLNSARKEINNLLESHVFHEDNTVNNLEQRGNTASTSHFIALADQMRDNKIQSGDKVVFSISASGLTVGTAFYVFDDLPDRFRATAPPRAADTGAVSGKDAGSVIPPGMSGIRIESVGTAPESNGRNRDALELLHAAATNCLEKSRYACNDIGLLIHTGVYRNEYLMEPAYAALLAGRLDMNATISDAETRKTLAFDIFNGSVGFLNACFAAQQMITAGNGATAMIVAAEIENNAGVPAGRLMGLRETASAVILDAHPGEGRGFSRFLFRYHTESLNAYTSYAVSADGKHALHIDIDPDIEKIYVEGIVSAVGELLRQEGLELHQIDAVFPPQISAEFIAQLSRRLELPAEKFIAVAGDGPDLFSSSIPFGLEYACEKRLVKPGDTGLLIAAGSGVQVGCAIYHF